MRDGGAGLNVSELTAQHGAAIAGWRYSGRDAVYDVTAPLRAEDGFWSVLEEGELIGYCCLGFEARVPGLTEETGTVDIGWGLRPDLIEQGRGRAFVGTILGFAAARCPGHAQRVAILAWNERSLRVARAHGFRESGTVGTGDRTFTVLRRFPGSADSPSAPGETLAGRYYRR
jgi:ribosomal-protein-alanine N-acetyltransferase